MKSRPKAAGCAYDFSFVKMRVAAPAVCVGRKHVLMILASAILTGPGAPADARHFPALSL